MASGWKQLIPSASPFRGEGLYPLEAYSEYMPPPRLGWKPYGSESRFKQRFATDDPHGWIVSEYEEVREIQQGLFQVAQQVLGKLARLCDNDPTTGIPRLDLKTNPFWPPELAADTTPLPHERCVTLLPLALSRTQDDKGRVAWTLFGNSEQGPSKAFWKSFFAAPGREVVADQAIGFFCRLLRDVYGEAAETADELHRAGFRILPDEAPLFPFWHEGQLPSWTASFLYADRPCSYLLTFRPFAKLPIPVQRAYLAGKLHLLPFPGSLVFWGAPIYAHLHQELPFALQIPLLHLVNRHRDPKGLRVPQDGFLHEPGPGQPGPQHHAGPVRNTYKRTHRWDRILRDQDELALLGSEDKLLHVLFSTIPEDISLYNKPMARNVQMWTTDGKLLLDGPHADSAALQKVMRTVQAGGTFGYRFHFPPMRVGRHEVYWHRPLVAYRARETGEVVVMHDAPKGYLTAYVAGQPRFDKPIELWPRVRERKLLLATMPWYGQPGKGPTTARNVRKLADAQELLGDRPVPRRLARQLLTLSRAETLETWSESLPGPEVAAEVRSLIEPEERPLPSVARRGRSSVAPASLTFDRTGRRSFELAYWKTIVTLAEGHYLNKNNADCVRDATTQSLLAYHERHLEPLGEFLLEYYRKQIARVGLSGKALAGALPIQWRTDFDFSWMGGWLRNQELAAERNLLTVIPGKDRGRAVIMADHYDTAYMYDRYDRAYGGKGARVAACGADDNHSATAALMLAAPIFLEMSKAGRLSCDVWLIHLTGEEFPADCLGARHLTQRLVEDTLELHLPNGKHRRLSGVEVKGVYVSDMIAHNNDRDRDVFQIAPGTGANSFWLASQAHLANEVWNASAAVWNQRPERLGRGRARRSPYGAAIPEVAAHLALSGEVRPVTDPRSTLYNTDGQIFSDAGVPVVLFMENYDINRTGYHDTHDTMANIDLDYGAALAAIVIESVARAACDMPV